MSDYSDASALLCNCTAIRQAARHVTRFYDACMAEVGLRGTQYIILLFLSRRGPVSMAELAQAVVMDRTTMSHNLEPLARDGLVSVKVGATDKRSRVIALTAAGRRRVEQGRAAWQRAQDHFEEKFGRAPAQKMRKMMAAVVATELDLAGS